MKMESPKSITLESLQKFCSKAENPIEITRPYFNRGWIVATDSRILVLVDPTCLPPIEGKFPSNGPDIKPEIFHLDHDALPPEIWVPVPQVKVKQVVCKKCRGSGKIHLCTKCGGYGKIDCKCLDCGHEHEAQCPVCLGDGRDPKAPEIKCPDCDGDGKMIDEVELGVDIGSMHLNKVYLEKISLFLPNPLIERRTVESYDPVRFKFDGGIGVLMPMRKY